MKPSSAISQNLPGCARNAKPKVVGGTARTSDLGVRLLASAGGRAPLVARCPWLLHGRVRAASGVVIWGVHCRHNANVLPSAVAPTYVNLIAGAVRGPISPGWRTRSFRARPCPFILHPVVLVDRTLILSLRTGLCNHGPKHACLVRQNSRAERMK